MSKAQMGNAFNLEDLRSAPAYSIAEAAAYLRMPPATLRSWIVGRPYPTSSGSKYFHRLITPADAENFRLSFINLVEGHVLSAIRREHNVSIQNVRKALNFVQKEFGADRPLIQTDFETDGVDLFVEKYGRLINASKHGQLEMKEVIKQFLKRVVRDASGIPIKLFPFTRQSAHLNQPRTIEIDPKISFGRPVIVGTGIRTEVLSERFLAGESTAELAKDYGRAEEEIQEAIRYQKLAA